jgi:hypothetical protein
MRATTRGALSAGVVAFLVVVVLLIVGGIALIDLGLRSMSGNLTVVGIVLLIAGCYAFTLPMRAHRRTREGGETE